MNSCCFSETCTALLPRRYHNLLMCRHHSGIRVRQMLSCPSCCQPGRGRPVCRVLLLHAASAGCMARVAVEYMADLACRPRRLGVVLSMSPGPWHEMQLVEKRDQTKQGLVNSGHIRQAQENLLSCATEQKAHCVYKLDVRSKGMGMRAWNS